MDMELTMLPKALACDQACTAMITGKSIDEVEQQGGKQHE